jgi:diguanylate cyclase (GGDEF)-like protein
MAKILVIEDEVQVLDNIQEILELEDFDTITAENGCVGVQLALAQVPDLIICDVMMPELDGYGVLSALRQYSATAAIPLIFLTAKADRSDLRQGMLLGADDYLTKPFTPSELLKAIATRLEKQAAVRERYMNQITEVEAKLNHLVYHESLTDLPNQLFLRERFNQLQAQVDCKELTSILLVGLDQFNWINSNLGHKFSSLLIKAVAERLSTYISNVTSSNIDTLVHLSPDQFAILLKTIQPREDAAKVAQTILDILSQPFALNGHEVVLTASIGIALYPYDSSDIDDLTINAELAIGHAQQQGGNHYQFYTADMKSGYSNRIALEASLRHALEREEFQVYYQPRVDLRTGKIISAEALVRWNHP